VDRSSNLSNQESIYRQYKQRKAFPGFGEKKVKFIMFTLRTVKIKSKSKQLFKKKNNTITTNMSKHSVIEIEAKLANGLENENEADGVKEKSLNARA
jgi:hypothetical protein